MLRVHAPGKSVSYCAVVFVNRIRYMGLPVELGNLGVGTEVTPVQFRVSADISWYSGVRFVLLANSFTNSSISRRCGRTMGEIGKGDGFVTGR